MVTSLTQLACNSCGAPLQVPDDVRYITCQHCGSQLEVHRSGNVAYTEVIENLSRRTEQLSRELEVTKLESQIDRLDHQWESSQKDYLMTSEDGRSYTPSSAGAVVWVVVATIMGFVVMTAFPPEMSWFGWVIVLFGIIGGVWMYFKAQAYQEAKDEYERQRSQTWAKMYERRRRP